MTLGLVHPRTDTENQTAKCGPQIAVRFDDFAHNMLCATRINTRYVVVGRERRVSRVLYPLRDGDHLSRTSVARGLQRPIPEGWASRR